MLASESDKTTVMRLARSVLLAAVAGVGLLVQPALAQTTAKPPLEVFFSTPSENEADVRLDIVIRIQFSRGLNAASIKDRVFVRYSESESKERGEAQPPAVAFEASYDVDRRSIVIQPTQRLERFRHVIVELLEGIEATDGSVLKGWRLNFNTGGS
jgi:Bacterial Ig-like domain